MKFNWLATNNAGQKAKGVREAVDRYALARDLRSEGLSVISAKVIRRRDWRSFFESLSLKDKIIFASNLAAMLKAGLALSRALEVISRRASRPLMRKVAQQLSSRVSSGESLSESLKSLQGIFPPIFIAMVASGEESGRLSEVLQTTALQMKKTYELRRKVKGALIYPAIIITAIIVIGVLMMIFLLPVLVETFTELDVDLPASTRIIILLSEILRNQGLYLLVGLIILIIISVAVFKVPSGRRIIDRIILFLPFFGSLSRKTNTAVMARTLSSLLTSGVGLAEALRITSRVVSNSQFSLFLNTAAERVQKGILLSKIFITREDLILPFASELISVGEETGDMPTLLLEGANFYEDEVDDIAKNLSTILEPALMIVIGIAVGFFAISMLSPLYSLGEAF